MDVRLRHLTDALAMPGRDGAPVVMFRHPVQTRDPAGQDPRVRLILSRHPLPTESNVRHLIIGATLSIRLRLVPIADELAMDANPVWPLAQQLSLRHGSSHLATGFVEHANSVRLSARLDHAAALGLLGAVYSRDVSLTVDGTVDYRSVSGVSSADFACPLHHIVDEKSSTVELVVAGEDSLEPAERRTVTRSTTSAGRNTAGPIRALSTASLHGVKGLQAVSAAFAKPNSSVASTAYLDALSGVHGAGHLALGDVVWQTPRSPMPLVDTPSAPLWRDASDANFGWYPPEVKLATPDAARSVADSTFAFRFERAGVTAVGEPALRAQIRFDLTVGQSEETLSAIDAATFQTIRPVPMLGVAARLGIPFVDSTTGETKMHLLDGEVTKLADSLYRCTFSVLGDWVRLAYGTLALTGFQKRSAEVSVSYRFEGASKTTPAHLSTVFGNKLVGLHLGSRKPPNGVLQLKRKDLSLRRGGHALSRFNREKSKPALMHRAELTPVLAQYVAARPLVVNTPQKDSAFATRSFVRRNTSEALVPCARFGHLYLDTTDMDLTGVDPVAVGCTDALRLGTIAYELHRDMPALASDRYRVSREIQQPGRFLVTPDRYLIGRREPNDPVGGYQPYILLYAHLDPNSNGNSQVIFEALMIPEFTPADGAALTDNLTSHTSATPQLSFPHMLRHDDIEWSWNIAVPDTEAHAQVTPDGVRVTITTSVLSWNLIRNMLESGGIIGSAAIELADGSVVRTNLDVDLRQLAGPMSAGAIEVASGPTSATLRNRTESAIDIDALVVVSNTGSVARTRVEASLQPGRDLTIPVVDAADVFVDHRTPLSDPVELDEIRSYVENIDTTLALINLANLENRGLTRVHVDVRMSGDLEAAAGPPQRVVFDTANHLGDVTFVMPLTRYLTNPTIEYRTTSFRSTGSEAPTEWTPWNIADNGVVISFSWDDISTEDTP